MCTSGESPKLCLLLCCLFVKEDGGEGFFRIEIRGTVPIPKVCFVLRAQESRFLHNDVIFDEFTSTKDEIPNIRTEARKVCSDITLS